VTTHGSWTNEVLKVSAQPLKIMNTHYCQRAKLFLHGGIVWHLMCNLGSAAAAAATLAVRSAGMRHFSLFLRMWPYNFW
jgi:hypothetical protein